MVAVQNPGFIYVSTSGIYYIIHYFNILPLSKGGLRWAQTNAPSNKWYSVASSSNGHKIAAVVDGGGIYVTADGGINWSLTSAVSAAWYSIASDSTGTYLAAVQKLGYIYTTTSQGK